MSQKQKKEIDELKKSVEYWKKANTKNLAAAKKYWTDLQDAEMLANGAEGLRTALNSSNAAVSMKQDEIKRKDDEIKELKRTCDDLGHVVSRKNLDLNCANGRISALENSLKSFEELNTQYEQFKALSGDPDSFVTKEKYEGLELKLAKATKESIDWESLNTENVAIASERWGEIQELKDKLESKTIDAKQHESISAANFKIADARRIEIRDLKEKLKSVENCWESEVDELKAKIKHLGETSDVARLKIDLAGKSEGVEHLKQQRENVRNDNDRLVAENIELKSASVETDMLKFELNALRKDSAKEIKELESDLECKQATVDILIDEKNKRAAYITRLKEDLKGKSKELKVVRGSKDEIYLRKKVDGLRRDLVVAKSQFRVQSDFIKRLGGDEFARLQEKIELLQETIKEQTKAEWTLQLHSNKQYDEIERFKEELKRRYDLIVERKDTITRQADSIGQLHEEAKELDAELAELKQEISELKHEQSKERVEKLEDTITRQSNTIRERDSQLGQKLDEIKRLNCSIGYLAETNENLSNEIKKLKGKQEALAELVSEQSQTIFKHDGQFCKELNEIKRLKEEICDLSEKNNCLCDEFHLKDENLEKMKDKFVHEVHKGDQLAQAIVDRDDLARELTEKLDKRNKRIEWLLMSERERNRGHQARPDRYDVVCREKVFGRGILIRNNFNSEAWEFKGNNKGAVESLCYRLNNLSNAVSSHSTVADSRGEEIRALCVQLGEAEKKNDELKANLDPERSTVATTGWKNDIPITVHNNTLSFLIDISKYEYNITRRKRNEVRNM